MSLQNKTKYSVFIFIFTIALLSTNDLFAQRMGHAASRGGGRGGQSMSRQAPNRSAANRNTTRQSSSNRGKASNTRQTTSRPAGNRSINGGHQKSTDRKNISSNRSTNRNNNTYRNTNKSVDRSNKSVDRSSKNIDRSNKNVDRSKVTNNRGGNNINIDNSKNININQNNTRVVAGSRGYARPPYRYGGFGYYCHRPYSYHPYRPFYWGPAWHPWGWFAATIATTAIIVSINNQKYHYDQGTYYVESGGGYTVVQAPVGATVKTIPKEAEVVEVNETTNNYYYGGAYYEKSDEGYTVVPATAGTIVPNLPEGGEEVKIGDVTYVQFGDTYYQPIQVDGKDMYEIVEVKE